MGLFSKKEEIITKPVVEEKKSMYLNADGTPKTIIRTGKSYIFDLTNTKARNITNMNNYLKYYQNESTVWAAVNSIAFNTAMTGYIVDSNDTKALDLIKRFCVKVDIDEVILESTVNALVLGDAFIEIIYNKKGEPTRLKNVDPRTMTIKYDDHGDIEKYIQEVNHEKVELTPEYMCHIKLFNRPDSPYGISIIEPSLETIKKKVRTDTAIANSIIRHGLAKYLVTVGQVGDKELPPDSVLTQIKADLKDIDEKNEFIVPWNVKIESIDSEGVKGVEEYYSYFQTQMVIGLLCPEEALGMGQGSTESTATVKAVLYERMINSFQNKISRTIERDIFNHVLLKNNFEIDSVDLVFSGVTEQDEAMKAKWFGDMFKGFRTSTIKPFTINEVRGIFGKKPFDIPEANTLFYGEIPKSEPKVTDGEVNDEELDLLLQTKQDNIYTKKLDLIKKLNTEIDNERN
jgi:hypothetical protein